MVVDKALLLAKRSETPTGFPEEDVEIPGMGTVRVRGLSRHEVLHIQRAGKGGKDVALVEQLTISLGLLDPVMTQDEVKQWQKVSGSGEMDQVTETIGRLSGMFNRPDRKAWDDFEADPGSEFRVPPSSDAGSDGSGIADDRQQ